MGFDVDDVGAVCLAHALEDAGKAKILAIVHDTVRRAVVTSSCHWMTSTWDQKLPGS